MTALGVVRREKAATNGILVSIPEAELPLFDQREDGYARTMLDNRSILSLNGQVVPEGSLWLYAPIEPGFPSEDYPIVQSYVDVVLTGCLEFGESFAAEFVRTTTNWGYPWIDDRSAPRYVRPTQNVSLAKYLEIDRILLENGAPLQGRVRA